MPPLSTASTPPSVIVPDPVYGPPEVVRPVVPPDTATLVLVIHDVFPEPSVLRMYPLVPPELGRVSDHVPAVAFAFTVVVPEVDPVRVKPPEPKVGLVPRTSEPLPVTF